MAAVIGYLMGYKIPLGNVREYIEHYGFTELFRAFARVERVVNFVIERTARKQNERALKSNRSPQEVMECS